MCTKRRDNLPNPYMTLSHVSKSRRVASGKSLVTSGGNTNSASSAPNVVVNHRCREEQQVKSPHAHSTIRSGYTEVMRFDDCRGAFGCNNLYGTQPHIEHVVCPVDGTRTFHDLLPTHVLVKVYHLGQFAGRAVAVHRILVRIPTE